MKISMPIAIRMIPPKMMALSASFMPNDLPRMRPAMQMKKVVMPMMRLARSASDASYSAIVKPTERASMEVAIPCRRSAFRP